MEEKTKNILFALAFVYILVGILFYLGASITGYVIYVQTDFNLNLIPENFVYNNSQIAISEGKIKLSEIINEYQEIKEEDKNYYIKEALSNEKKDVTSNVVSLDGNYVNTKDLSIKFDSDVINNDTVRLYLKEVGHNNTIYLCSKELDCMEKNHGKIYYNDIGSLSFKKDGILKVKIIGIEASLSSDVYLLTSSGEELLIKNAKNNLKKEFNKIYPAGTDFKIFIRVNGTPLGLGVYDHYYDTKFAVVEETEDNKLKIGFEDLPEDKTDWDYNDLVLEVEMDQDNSGWYNFSVNNLQEPADEFQLISKRPVKYDYIDAVHKEISVYNYTIISYFQEAELNSNEIILNGTVQAILVNKTLNNGAVFTFYSNDNGANWLPLTEDTINSNYSNIKLKLVFGSNQNQTPEVNEIKLVYLVSTEETNQTSDTNQTEQNTTTETPAPSSGGGGGGGGGGHSREETTEEIVITDKTKQEIYRIPVQQPQDEKKIVVGETEVPKPVSDVPFLVGLTAKILYSGKNIGNFLFGNWGWLILIILLFSAYAYLYLRRKKDRMRKRKK